jgi:hypothetical protein
VPAQLFTCQWSAQRCAPANGASQPPPTQFCFFETSPMPVTETWVDANIVTLIGGIVFCLIGCKLADAVKFFRTAQVEEKDGV